MTTAELLADALGRVREVVHEVAAGLTPSSSRSVRSRRRNSIGWLLWHLTRVQDDHVADVAGTEQVWTSGGWVGRFGLPFDDAETGWGQNAEAVAAVRMPSADLLTGYHDDVFERVGRVRGELTDADLGRIVDERWDPPVSLGVRLVSVLADDLQHAGQAAYLRGLVARR